MVILMHEQVHYIIISEAPKKAVYHSDMRTFKETSNYKETYVGALDLSLV